MTKINVVLFLFERKKKIFLFLCTYHKKETTIQTHICTNFQLQKFAVPSTRLLHLYLSFVLLSLCHSNHIFSILICIGLIWQTKSETSAKHIDNEFHFNGLFRYVIVTVVVVVVDSLQIWKHEPKQRVTTKIPLLSSLICTWCAGQLVVFFLLLLIDFNLRVVYMNESG